MSGCVFSVGASVTSASAAGVVSSCVVSVSDSFRDSFNFFTCCFNFLFFFFKLSFSSLRSLYCDSNSEFFSFNSAFSVCNSSTLASTVSLFSDSSVSDFSSILSISEVFSSFSNTSLAIFKVLLETSVSSLYSVNVNSHFSKSSIPALLKSFVQIDSLQIPFFPAITEELLV